MSSARSKIMTRVALPAAALVAAMAAAPSAVATGFTPPPAGVEAGEVSLTLKGCTFGPLTNQTLTATLEGTFNSVDAPGQQFELTNGSGSLTIPKNTVAAIYGFGGRTANGEITTIDLNAKNATPATVNAAGSGLPIATQTLNPKANLVIPIPASGSLTVGPFTAGSKGPITLSFGATAGTFNVYDGSGGSVLSNQSVSCKAPSPVVNLSTATVGGSGTGLNAPGAYSFASVPLTAGQVTGSVTSNVTCTGPSIPSATYTTTYNVTGPTLLTHGTTASASGSGQIVVPTNVVNALVTLGAKTLSGSITALNVNVTDASPAVVNLASSPIAFGPLTLVKNKTVTIAVPASGTLSGSVTPTAAGLLTLGVGSDTANVTFSSSTGKTVGSGTLSCAAPSPAVIIGGETVK